MPLRVALDETWLETKLLVVCFRALPPFDKSILVVLPASLAIVERLRHYVLWLQIGRVLMVVDEQIWG